MIDHGLAATGVLMPFASFRPRLTHFLYLQHFEKSHKAYKAKKRALGGLQSPVCGGAPEPPDRRSSDVTNPGPLMSEQPVLPRHLVRALGVDYGRRNVGLAVSSLGLAPRTMPALPGRLQVLDGARDVVAAAQGAGELNF